MTYLFISTFAMMAYLLSLVVKTRGNFGRWFLSIALPVACLAAFSVLMSLLYCKIDFWITLGTCLGIMLPATVVMMILLLHFLKTDKWRTAFVSPFVILGAVMSVCIFIVKASESRLLGTPLFAGESFFSVVVWIFMLLLTLCAMRMTQREEKSIVKMANDVAPAQDNSVEAEAVDVKNEETEDVDVKSEEPKPEVAEPTLAPKAVKQKKTRKISVRRLMLAAFCLVAVAALCFIFLSPSELGEYVFVERRSSTSGITHSKENCKEISGGIMKMKTKNALQKIKGGNLLYCNKCMSDEMISRYSESHNAKEKSENDQDEYEIIAVPDYEAADSAAAPTEGYGDDYCEENSKDYTDYIFVKKNGKGEDIKISCDEFGKNPNAYRDYTVRMVDKDGTNYDVPFQHISNAVKDGAHVFRMRDNTPKSDVAKQAVDYIYLKSRSG
ncbi:MAG: Yip1 family protein [Prevotella sp.]